MFENYNVLFVDDDENILNSLKRGLIDEEYFCFFANSADEGMKVMEKEDISVVVSDMRMPGKDGLVFLKEVKERFPMTVRIVLSGYTQLQQILATVNQADVFKFITKPWKLESEFKGVIIKALEYYKMHKERDEYEIALKKKNESYQNILKKIDNNSNITKTCVNQMIELSDIVFKTFTNKLASESNDNIIKNTLESGNIFLKSVFGGTTNRAKRKESDNFIISILQELKKIRNISKLESDTTIKKIEGELVYRQGIFDLIKILVAVFCKLSSNNLVKLTFSLDKDNEKELNIIIIIVNKIIFKSAIEKYNYEKYNDYILTMINNVSKILYDMEFFQFRCARSDFKIIQKYSIKYYEKEK
jgi:CheY-like chemotaxis protein